MDRTTAKVRVSDKTGRHHAILLLDMHSSIWGNRSIVVRNESMTPRQAAELVDPDTDLAGINSWYFSHPETRKGLAISDLVANPDLRRQVMTAHKVSDFTDPISNGPSISHRFVRVFGYHKGHRLEADLVLKYVEQGNVRNKPSVRFQGEWLYTLRAAQKAILSIDPGFTGKVNGVAF